MIKISCAYCEKITEKEVPNIRFTWDKARAALPPNAVMHTLQFDSMEDFSYWREAKQRARAARRSVGSSKKPVGGARARRAGRRRGTAATTSTAS